MKKSHGSGDGIGSQTAENFRKGELKGDDWCGWSLRTLERYRDREWEEEGGGEVAEESNRLSLKARLHMEIAFGRGQSGKSCKGEETRRCVS
eukprot:610142-Pleurochrysis_carterae.AAC.2